MSKRTRRQFLEDSMFATAAAIAAGSTTEVFAADKKSASANEKLKVAILGVNSRGKAHIHGFLSNPNTEITHIVDPDEAVWNKHTKAIAQQQGKAPKFVKDLREVNDDKSVDIVSIATPNHWHALAAIWALQAGKDVYVEKPVSHNVSEGRRIVEAARKYNKICQTGTQSRSNDGMIQTIKFLKEGHIGKVQVARGLCYKRRKSIGPRGTYEVPASVDYNLWAGPTPKAPLTRKRFHYDWHWQWLCGNGDLGNQGIHQVDICRWGMGQDKLCSSVTSYGGRLGYTDAGETANTQVAMFEYGDQSLVFEVRGLETAPYRGAKIGVIFECTDGYCVIPTYNQGTFFDKNGKVIKSFKGGGDTAHFDNFVDAVKSRKVSDLNADIEQGHISSALCHLSNISYRLGSNVSAGKAIEKLKGVKTNDNVKETLDRTVKHLAENNVDTKSTELSVGATLAFNPETETFVNNKKADAMLTRKYRAPFVVPEKGKV